MNEINEDLIYKQFEDYSYDIMNRTFNKLLKRKEKDEKKASKVREEKFNEAIKELLEICPQVSMIPVGESYQCYEECYDTNDFDSIYELTYDNLSDEAIPKQYDDMTIGTYKRMMKLWEIACKNSPIVYEEFDGDYCTRAHVSLYYFDRESNKIKETNEF